MPQYQMPINSSEAQARFDALDDFTQGYVTCALWCGIDQEDEIERTFDVLADYALANMVVDCKDFQERNRADLDEWDDDRQAGHDFWLTRNGHGAGFWDRDRDDLGDRLSDAARAYGCVDLYFGDDGLLYAS